jgi:hypothetical protein
MVGITEAVRYGGRDLRDIRLLSVGTTSQTLRVESHHAALGMGLKDWAGKALDLLRGSVSMAAHHQARLLLGDDHYLRLDSDNARKVKLDDAEQCRPLQEWGHDVGRNNIELITRLPRITAALTD